jgi:hypothetical protein
MTATPCLTDEGRGVGRSPMKSLKPSGNSSVLPNLKSRDDCFEPGNFVTYLAIKKGKSTKRNRKRYKNIA